MPLGVLLLAAGGVFYYRVGQHEHGAGFIDACVSIALLAITWVALGWGWLGHFLGQDVLLAGMTWYNIKRSARSK
jgi:hypothetical protein